MFSYFSTHFKFEVLCFCYCDKTEYVLPYFNHIKIEGYPDIFLWLHANKNKTKTFCFMFIIINGRNLKHDSPKWQNLNP